jgi:hypothetical protein
VTGVLIIIRDLDMVTKAEGKLCKHPGRKQPPVRQGERPQKVPTLPTP